MQRPFLPVLIVSLALAGCGQTPKPANPAGRPAATKPGVGKPAARPAAPRPRPPAYQPPATPRAQTAPGLEAVIGANREALLRQFGEPRLDGYEGDVRKLQFAGAACVLDVFLYPPAAGREPLASYVEARRASDGQDVDDAACVAALRR